MPKHILSLLVVLFFVTIQVASQEAFSPDKSIKLNFSLDTKGTPTYQLFYKNEAVIKSSQLGFSFKNDAQGLKNGFTRSEEHTSELQSREKLVCRLLLEKKKQS